MVGNQKTQQLDWGQTRDHCSRPLLPPPATAQLSSLMRLLNFHVWFRTKRLTHQHVNKSSRLTPRESIPRDFLMNLINLHLLWQVGKSDLHCNCISDCNSLKLKWTIYESLKRIKLSEITQQQTQVVLQLCCFFTPRVSPPFSCSVLLFMLS